MLSKRMKFCLFTLLIMLLSGCSSINAPYGWLPDNPDSNNLNNGGWLYIEINKSAKNVTFLDMDSSMKSITGIETLAGEFISYENNNVYLMSRNNKLCIIPIKEIRYSCLELTEKNTGAIVGLGLLGTISTISNGWFLIFTAPVWLITTIASAASEASRDNYCENYPKNNYWHNINKFSRFPQGVPKDVDLRKLKIKKG